MRAPGPLTWWVEDIRVCLDVDPDSSRGPARELMYVLDRMTKRGWDVRTILNLGGADLGESVLLVCASKGEKPSCEKNETPKRKYRKRATQPLQEAAPEVDSRSVRLAKILEELAIAKAKTDG